MIRTSFKVLLALAAGAFIHSFASPRLSAQDMPLSGLLVEGAGWEVVAEGFGFTDGAASDAEGNFYFADVTKGDIILRVDLEGRLSEFAKNVTRISGMQFGPDGKLYACQATNPGKILAFDPSGKMEIVAEDVQPNDLVVTSQGTIYFTETGKSQVTRIRPGQKPEKAGTGPSKPNGITLSLDQESLAVSDYGGENVWVWRIHPEKGLQFAAPYMSLRLPSPMQASKGDGMATDAQGRYYVTSAVGLQVFDPTGRLCGVLPPPEPKPMVSVELSGPGMSYLFVCCGDKIYRRKTQAKGVLFFQPPK
ncbi:MAG: SMP-30/gluconolactonase/LRE family protein [Pirellulales bacterium]